MSLTKLSLGENNLYMTSIFPPWESLVSDIPAEDRNIEKLFFTVYDSLERAGHGYTRVMPGVVMHVWLSCMTYGTVEYINYIL
jgi:hypothetical protein